MLRLAYIRTFFVLAVIAAASVNSSVVAEEKSPEKSPDQKGSDADDDYVAPPKEYLGLLDANVGDFDEEYKIIKDYHTTYTKLNAKKADDLNDRGREILKAYRDGENIALILNATQETLGNLRENPLMRPQTRVEEMRQLMAIEKTWVELSAPKEAEPAKVQSELRKPSKEEEEEIAAFLEKIISLLDKKKYKEVTSNYVWYTPSSTPIFIERESSLIAKRYLERPQDNPAPLFRALLNGRRNWFMHGEYKAVLIREKRYETELPPAAICVGLEFDQEKAKWLFHREPNPISLFYEGALPELK